MNEAIEGELFLLPLFGSHAIVFCSLCAISTQNAHIIKGIDRYSRRGIDDPGHAAKWFSHVA
ncbi:hypothetical protein GCM10008022_33880 [Paenibacillus hunanensis]|nr:hypothetical protein GCM10008022_33880 [Paenibacillus hunanensis]